MAPGEGEPAGGLTARLLQGYSLANFPDPERPSAAPPELDVADDPGLGRGRGEDKDGGRDRSLQSLRNLGTGGRRFSMVTDPIGENP
jgi:hypothetical protein